MSSIGGLFRCLVKHPKQKNAGNRKRALYYASKLTTTNFSNHILKLTIQVDYGHEEVMVKFGGDPRRFNTQSQEFLFDDLTGRVSGIRTILVEWKKVDGRWSMSEVPDSEKVYPCQMVLLAMGFLGPEDTVFESLKVERDNRSNVKTSGYSTSIDRVFAAGDCRRGQSLVVWAITEGRQAAREIDNYLMGDTQLPVAGGIIHPMISLSAQA
jgi:glutamate synthase (NADPH/NADH)